MGTYLLQSQSPKEPSVLLVCVLGIGVVFVGLALLVGIVTLMNTFFRKKNNNETVITATKSPATQLTTAVNTTRIENKQELIAAICAAVAEENGTDISAIRVISFKKI